ncbi:high mobility group protein B2-like isoform X2 [Photinus pyralis]|uniref:high mobility group protein B2-like isoform X2 n=1 Tax=Photinus pyralis TaxID=7054 RepID=UPI0012670042|nr:high mobility group protein B2-like isoform X2 [Photinus pyralis]
MIFLQAVTTVQSAVQQQHQAAEVHRQQEVQRHQAEAQAARQQQAVAEAQARHQSQQQQNHLQQQNHQSQQNHQHTQTLHQPLQNHQSLHLQSANHQVPDQKSLHQISHIQVPTRGRMPRGKADSRPRGRMTAYAFFVQTCREEHKKKHPEENVVFAEFSKKCAERWKTMLDKEKKRFHEMAEKDKKRYDAEMQNYTPPKGEKQRGKKRKQIKDPNAPKRSLSAFFWFCNDERSKVKSQNPEYGVGDIAKELGRRWAEADSDVKSKYEAMAEKDKARYEKEMTAYKKKNNPAMPAAPVPEADDEDDEEEELEDDEDE